jgi:hypothetical protein
MGDEASNRARAARIRKALRDNETAMFVHPCTIESISASKHEQENADRFANCREMAEILELYLKYTEQSSNDEGWFPITITALCTALYATRRRVIRLMAELDAAGYVETDASGGERALAGYRYRITKTGFAVAEKGMEAFSIPKDKKTSLSEPYQTGEAPRCADKNVFLSAHHTVDADLHRSASTVDAPCTKPHPLCTTAASTVDAALYTRALGFWGWVLGYLLGVLGLRARGGAPEPAAPYQSSVNPEPPTQALRPPAPKPQPPRTYRYRPDKTIDRSSSAPENGRSGPRIVTRDAATREMAAATDAEVAKRRRLSREEAIRVCAEIRTRFPTRNSTEGESPPEATSPVRVPDDDDEEGVRKLASERIPRPTNRAIERKSVRQPTALDELLRNAKVERPAENGGELPS